MKNIKDKEIIKISQKNLNVISQLKNRIRNVSNKIYLASSQYRKLESKQNQINYSQNYQNNLNRTFETQTKSLNQQNDKFDHNSLIISDLISKQQDMTTIIDNQINKMNFKIKKVKSYSIDNLESINKKFEESENNISYKLDEISKLNTEIEELEYQRNLNFKKNQDNVINISNDQKYQENEILKLNQEIQNTQQKLDNLKHVQELNNEVIFDKTNLQKDILKKQNKLDNTNSLLLKEYDSLKLQLSNLNDLENKNKLKIDIFENKLKDTIINNNYLDLDNKNQITIINSYRSEIDIISPELNDCNNSFDQTISNSNDTFQIYEQHQDEPKQINNLSYDDITDQKNTIKDTIQLIKSSISFKQKINNEIKAKIDKSDNDINNNNKIINDLINSNNFISQNQAVNKLSNLKDKNFELQNHLDKLKQIKAQYLIRLQSEKEKKSIKKLDDLKNLELKEIIQSFLNSNKIIDDKPKNKTYDQLNKI